MIGTQGPVVSKGCPCPNWSLTSSLTNLPSENTALFRDVCCGITVSASRTMVDSEGIGAEGYLG